MTPSEEIFESLVRPDGKLAGVYEQDSDSGYFYLYDLQKPDGQKVVGAIQLHSGTPIIASDDVSIEWDRTGTVIGLFVKGVLWAAFSESGDKWQAGFIGDDHLREVPEWLTQAFAFERFH